MAQMARRVLTTVDVFVISANKADSDCVKLDFELTLLYSDEGGQNTIANLAVPLTAYIQWLALVIYGDPKQLYPPVMSKVADEFILNAKLSPMEMLSRTGHPFIQLKEQYRMVPESSKFPNQRFHRGLLTDHAVTKRIPPKSRHMSGR